MQSALIEHRAGYLCANGERLNGRELAELYRALAVECLAKQADRVLVHAPDGSAEGLLALRDAFTTMILAGIPSGFKLAMIATAPGTRHFLLELQADLQRLDIDAALFVEEATAVEWLLGKAVARTSTAKDGARPQR